MRRGALSALIAIVALGGGLRLYAMDRTFPVGLIGDEIYYVKVALNLADGKGHRMGTGPADSREAFRPPAHPFLLSRFVAAETARSATAGPRHLDPAVRRPLVLLQVALGTLLIASAAALGCALFDTRVGLLAAVVTALHPTLIAFSHYLWSENLFAVLLTLGLTGFVLVDRDRRWRLAAPSGLLFGMAALTREIAIPIACSGALWWLWRAQPGRRGPALARGALLLGLTALAILPWTMRNYAVLHRVVPLATVGWFTMAQGNTLESPNWLAPDGPAQREFVRAYFALPDEIARANYARRHALERIRAEQPAWLFKKAMRNLALLFGPDSALLLKIRRGAYGEVSEATARAATTAAVVSHSLVVLFAALGIAGAGGAGRRSFPCFVLAAVAALLVVAYATPRYIVPLIPLLIVYASRGALTWRSLPGSLGEGRWIAPAVALAFYLGVCIPYHLAIGGAP